MNASRSLAIALCLVACDAAEPPSTPPDSASLSPVTASSPSAPSTSPAWASPSAESPSELDRVRRADLAAMKRLELVAPSARTVEQALALAEGRAALARADAVRLVEDLEREPKLRADPSTLAYAAKLALDQAAAPTLLAGLVAIGDPRLLDFVHDLGARADQSARLPLLIHDLLRVAAVHRKASRALAVLLDLEDAELCWQVANQLARASSDADSRAASMLERFKADKGCGPKKLDDCLPCLREPANADALQKAIEAVASRKFDAPWLTNKK